MVQNCSIKHKSTNLARFFSNVEFCLFQAFFSKIETCNYFPESFMEQGSSLVQNPDINKNVKIGYMHTTYCFVKNWSNALALLKK